MHATADTRLVAGGQAPRDGRPTIAVVVPAHRASFQLRRCLSALAACDPAPDEIVVVVDGGDTETVALARRVTDRVVTLSRPSGPARARNAGAAAADAEVLFFIDSDVAVPPDGIARLAASLAARPEVAALIGSYDDRPPGHGLASQYKNLLNHHMHQHTRAEASTFWGACGAVRREAFDAVGGFDERYTRPSVEDIELGYRLRRAGHRIQVARELQVTHLKRWTVRSMVHADVRDRAVPWSELIISREGFSEDLNISRRQRLKTVIALGVAGAAVASPRWRAARAGAVGGVATLAVLDLPLLRFLARRRNVGFAVAAAGLHWVSYLYSAGAFAYAVLRRLRRRR